MVAMRSSLLWPCLGVGAEVRSPNGQLSEGVGAKLFGFDPLAGFLDCELCVSQNGLNVETRAGKMCRDLFGVRCRAGRVMLDHFREVRRQHGLTRCPVDNATLLVVQALRSASGIARWRLVLPGRCQRFVECRSQHCRVLWMIADEDGIGQKRLLIRNCALRQAPLYGSAEDFNLWAAINVRHRPSPPHLFHSQPASQSLD